MSDFQTGDIVIDRDDNQPSPAVIVNLPPIKAEDWDVNSTGNTVAEDNPEYDPTEQIAIIIFRSTLQYLYPKYTGKIPIKISKLAADRTNFYTFPRSRLKKIDSLDPVMIPIDQLKPNKYHSRNFSYDENESFIEEIAERGYPDPVPLVREIHANQYEIISGHKRTWAATAGGLEEIYCDVCYLTDETAAIKWAKRHLHEYSPEQLHQSVRALQKDYPNKNNDQLWMQI